MLFQEILELVDAIAKCLKVAHVEDLTANMKVEAKKLDMLHLFDALNGREHVFHGDTELVLSQSRRDVGVCVCPYVWVDAQADAATVFLAAANSLITSNSGTLSTLKQKISASNARLISQSLLPTPAKTILLAGKPLFRLADFSSTNAVCT